MRFKIFYGIINNNIEVTQIVFKNCVKHNIALIPSSDFKRANIFGDRLVNVLKSIFIKNEDDILVEYDHTKDIYIDVDKNIIFSENIPEYIMNIYPDFKEKLDNIHKNLKIDFGSFKDEYPEQLMATRYLSGNEKVLELGGNIGRNSLVIAYILNKNGNNNFVSLECDDIIAKKLCHNKDINKLNFHIENSALSKRKLIQRGWETFCSDILLEGYRNVNTITLEDLYSKYNINFDTLVLDCEGAFYYILMDMPEILDSIKLIIMENDYNNIEHKKYIDNILLSKNFSVNYSEAGGWGPCYSNFFEVWKKL